MVPASAFVADSALVLGDVELGEEASVWYGSIVRGDVYYIRIGSRTNIQDRCVLHVTTGRHATVVGAGVTVGHGAILHGCTIEDDVLIGMGATVLDEAHVSRGSLVGAGALLPPGKRYPEGSLIVGSPARVVRPLGAEERKLIARSAEGYVSLARRHASLTASAGD